VVISNEAALFHWPLADSLLCEGRSSTVSLKSELSVHIPQIGYSKWLKTSSGHLTSYVYVIDNDSADSLSFIHAAAAAAAENQRVGKTRRRSTYNADRQATDTTYYQPTSQPK